MLDWAPQPLPPMVLFGFFFKPQLTFGSLEVREGLEHGGAVAMVPEHGSALAGGCGVCFCFGGDLGPWRARGAAGPIHALVQLHLPQFSPSPSPSCCRGKPPPLCPRTQTFGGQDPPTPYPGTCQVRAGRTQLSTHKRGAVAAAASELPQNASHPPTNPPERSQHGAVLLSQVLVPAGAACATSAPLTGGLLGGSPSSLPLGAEWLLEESGLGRWSG